MSGYSHRWTRIHISWHGDRSRSYFAIAWRGRPSTSRHWTFFPRVHSSTQRSRCERAVTSKVARPNRHRNWPVETQARAIISAYQPRPLTSRPINRLLLLSSKSSDAPLTKNICSSYPACSLSPLKLILLLLLLLLSRTSSARIH